MYSTTHPNVVRRRQQLAAHEKRLAMQALGVRELPSPSQRRQHARAVQLVASAKR